MYDSYILIGLVFGFTLIVMFFVFGFPYVHRFLELKFREKEIRLQQLEGGDVSDFSGRTVLKLFGLWEKQHEDLIKENKELRTDIATLYRRLDEYHKNMVDFQRIQSEHREVLNLLLSKDATDESQRTGN